MSFFNMHFPLPLAANAAGMKHDTASKWIARGELVIRPEDREKVGRGGGVILSARSTLQLILAAELTCRGLKVSDACNVALDFAHMGDIAGEAGAKQSREPGHLFPEGLTILVINRTNPDRSKIRNYSGDEKLKDNLSVLDAVNVGHLFSMRLGSLGIDVHDAMQEIRG